MKLEHNDAERYALEYIGHILAEHGIDQIAMGRDRLYVGYGKQRSPLDISRTLACGCGWMVELVDVAMLTVKTPALLWALERHALDIVALYNSTIHEMTSWGWFDAEASV